MAKSLAWIWFNVVRFRRHIVLENVAIAFPELSDSCRRRIARRSLEHLCYCSIEFFLLHFLTAENLSRHVTIHGREHYDRAHALGSGVLLLSMHLGNVETLMAATALAGIKINVIAKRFRSAWASNIVYHLRERLGTCFIDPHSTKTSFEILRACRRNEAVGFIIDQFMRREYGVETTFFGRRTGTAYGLALFAIKTGAPVLPIYCYRDDDDHMHVVIEPPIPTVLSGNCRDGNVRALTQTYNDRIEAIIRRHPDQWMWVHRRWKPFD